MRKAVDAVLRAGIMSKGVRAAGLALILALQAAVCTQAAEEEFRVNDAGEEEIRYLREDGSYAPERWVKREGDWFYLNEDGEPMTDTVVLAMDDRYYALDEEGRRLYSGTVFSGGLPWEIDPDGTASVELSEDETAIREYAAEILPEIISGCVTDAEKAAAIFEDVWHMDISPSEELWENMQEAAIKAFDCNSGDCYGQAAKMHYLLQAAGIPDMTVVASEDGEFIAHWWNLIKIGDYYYHADATPFGADPDSGLLTLDEFRDFWEDIGEVDYLHQFDEGNYPKA